MDEQELKELFKSTFNTVAEGYDNSAMRFFSESAKRISAYLDLNGSEQVLDVATGTGCVALTIAEELPNGHVTGIDFSEGMLCQARKKKTACNLNNVTFSEMDMQAIDFPDKHFDIAVSGFSIFFVEDMKKQLTHIAEKVKSGGKIITTTFYDTAFSPLVVLFFERLEKYGIEPPSLAWKRVATQEQCLSLFSGAGLQNIHSEREECGYHLSDASEWWYVIWNAGFRGLVNQLSPEKLARFKREHLAEIQALSSDKGIWLEMSILYTIGSPTV